MHDATYHDALQTALTFANQVAPTGAEQRGFAQLVAAMQDEGENPSDICRAIVNRLADGMNYGNWPTA
jgi:hypothetical protein